MPWKATCRMKERLRFISHYLEGELSMSALCREFGISRKTGYKLVRRYHAESIDGLKDRPRSPHHHPNAVSEYLVEEIVLVRRQHPTWGPKKLRALLQRTDPSQMWPAASTIGDILHRHGLTVPRRRSRKTVRYTEPFTGCDYPNAVWSADFKGWFMTGDRVRCHPLTISDNYSRYLFRCQTMPTPDYHHVQPVFAAAFREYGLPVAIRTDNGAPFATTTVGGLSRLSIWWLKLGIIPERIMPGHPEQNGRHERMHRTLKHETAKPPKKTWRAQQRAFDRFRREFNQERPHEALGQMTPANLYLNSPREYPLIVPEMSYPDDMLIRSVKSQGDISWKSRHVYLSETLAGEPVGLKPISDRYYEIYYGPLLLAYLDSYERRLKHLPRSGKNNTMTKNCKKLLPMCPV